LRHSLIQHFFISSRRRHTRFSRDWSSDVCSSDLDGRDADRSRRTDQCCGWHYSQRHLGRGPALRAANALCRLGGPMAVDQIKKRLAAMQSNINGVVKAYPQMPKKHNGSFPIFTNHAGPATYDLRTFGEQAMLRPRTYIMRLWVKQVGLDTE